MLELLACLDIQVRSNEILVEAEMTLQCRR